MELEAAKSTVARLAMLTSVLALAGSGVALVDSIAKAGAPPAAPRVTVEVKSGGLPGADDSKPATAADKRRARKAALVEALSSVLEHVSADELRATVRPFDAGMGRHLNRERVIGRIADLVIS